MEIQIGTSGVKLTILDQFIFVYVTNTFNEQIVTSNTSLAPGKLSLYIVHNFTVTTVDISCSNITFYTI